MVPRAPFTNGGPIAVGLRPHGRAGAPIRIDEPLPRDFHSIPHVVL